MALQSNIKPEVPDHKLIRIIGEGGYGQVWLARTIIGQHRAVKIIYREDRSKFDREFEAICKYEPISHSHNGLVNIFHVGINKKSGYFYYVMELADDTDLPPGQPINDKTYHAKTLSTEIKKQKRIPLAGSLRICRNLLDALIYLHEKELVHRDIKPSNIIFINGKIKLADIGLLTTAHEGLTKIGTDGYMSPDGCSKPQSDLYSLGKVLYEISTGQDPRQFPALPPDLVEIANPKQIKRLNKIFIHACNPKPAKRYRSAKLFKQDVQRLYILSRNTKEGYKNTIWQPRIKNFYGCAKYADDVSDNVERFLQDNKFKTQTIESVNNIIIQAQEIDNSSFWNKFMRLPISVTVQISSSGADLKTAIGFSKWFDTTTVGLGVISWILYWPVLFIPGWNIYRMVQLLSRIENDIEAFLSSKTDRH